LGRNGAAGTGSGLLTRGRPMHSSAITLDRILDAARNAFSRDGFDRARLDEIGKAAGVSKQLVYHYFKTKDELYGVVLDRIAVEVLEMLDGPQYEQMAPAAAIEALIDRIMQNFVERPYLVGITVDQSLHKGEHVSRRSQYLPSVRKFVETRIVPILERGLASGEFRTSVDPYLFYWSVFTLATGVFFHDWSMSETSRIDLDEQARLDAWRKHVTALVLGGLGAGALPE